MEQRGETGASHPLQLAGEGDLGLVWHATKLMRIFLEKKFRMHKVLNEVYL